MNATTVIPWRLEVDERGFRRVYFGPERIYVMVNQNKEYQCPCGPVTIGLYKTDGVFTVKGVGDLSIEDAEIVSRALREGIDLAKEWSNEPV